MNIGVVILLYDTLVFGLWCAMFLHLHYRRFGPVLTNENNPGS